MAMNITKIEYVYECEGDIYECQSEHGKVTEAFVGLCKNICFSDFCEFHLKSITFYDEGGQPVPVRYIGWQPDLLYEFANEDDEIVASYYAPLSWEH